MTRIPLQVTEQLRGEREIEQQREREREILPPLYSVMLSEQQKRESVCENSASERQIKSNLYPHKSLIK